MNSWNRLLTSILGLTLSVLLLATGADAQSARVNRYSQKTFSGTFTSISGTGSYLTGGDDNYGGFSLPFSFSYDSVTWAAGTTLWANSNAWFCFGNTPTAASYANEVGVSSYANCVMIMVTDNNTLTGVYYQVTGTSPNRVVTMEWKDVGFWNYYSTNTTSMQIKLYETSNRIEFIYKDHGYSMGGTNWCGVAGIGLNGSTSPSFVYQAATSSATTTTPSLDIRWELPPPPAQLSLQPRNVNFGSLLAGQSVTQCVTVRSMGPNTLKILGAGISGASDYSIVSGPNVNDTFLAGQTAQYCIRFSPLTSGNRSATFVLSTNGQDSGTQQVNLTGVGIAPSISTPTTSLFRKTFTSIGKSTSVTFPVSSTGTGDLTFNSITATGPDASMFTITRMPRNPLPAGTTDSITVTFTPTYEGRADASIVINSNALNLPVITIPTFGVGILPRLTLTPTAVRFDSVRLGDSACQSITLNNPGSDTVRILRNGMTSADYDFTYAPLTGSDTIIPPGQSRTVGICFKPLRNGTRTAVIRINTSIPMTYETVRRDTSQFVINVSGTGVPSGALAVGGTLMDTSMVGVEHCVSDTIYNTGSADVVVTSATITGGDATNFALSSITFPFTLAGGSYKVVNVCFTPSARGVRSTSIVLNGTSGGRATTLTIPLGGYGLEACAQPSATSLFTTTKTLVSKTDTATVTIQNCGNMPATYSAALTQSGTSYSIVGATSTGVIAAGGSGSFTVTFTPSAIGSVPATLNVTGGPTPIPVTLGGTGGGVTLSAVGAAGNVARGDCKNFDVVITNNGNVDWTPGTPSISGTDAADFTYVSGPTPATVAPGMSGTVTLKFCASREADESAVLQFPAGAPSTYSYNLSGTGITSGVAMQSSKNGTTLDASYPNPAKSQASISFTLPGESTVRLEIVDQTGAVVKTLMNGRMSAGSHVAELNASELPSGTYFYVLTSGEVRLARQMTIVK